MIEIILLIVIVTSVLLFITFMIFKHIERVSFTNPFREYFKRRQIPKETSDWSFKYVIIPSLKRFNGSDKNYTTSYNFSEPIMNSSSLRSKTKCCMICSHLLFPAKRKDREGNDLLACPKCSPDLVQEFDKVEFVFTNDQDSK